jgi:hypothetical protein
MSTKYRSLYLSLGFFGLAMLIYSIVDALPEINPGTVLLIAIPDFVVFFLAYRTYPAEDAVEGQQA